MDKSFNHTRVVIHTVPVISIMHGSNWFFPVVVKHNCLSGRQAGVVCTGILFLSCTSLFHHFLSLFKPSFQIALLYCRREGRRTGRCCRDCGISRNLLRVHLVAIIIGTPFPNVSWCSSSGWYLLKLRHGSAAIIIS